MPTVSTTELLRLNAIKITVDHDSDLEALEYDGIVSEQEDIRRQINKLEDEFTDLEERRIRLSTGVDTSEPVEFEGQNYLVWIHGRHVRLRPVGQDAKDLRSIAAPAFEAWMIGESVSPFEHRDHNGTVFIDCPF